VNPWQKVLITLLGILIAAALLRPLWGPGYDSFFNQHFNSQLKHVSQVEQHIRSIESQWQEFKAANKGFEDIRFFAYTLGDGLFGASGSVASKEQLDKLRQFMLSTKPPRDVYLGLVSVVEDIDSTKQ